MFFDIDASLVYTRPHMTQVGGKVVIIEENILVKPTNNWKRIHISSNLIAAVQDSITNLNELFDIEHYGQMFAASSFETYKDIKDEDEPFLQLIINTEFNKLGSKEEAQILWDGDDFIDGWRDAFVSFEEYFEHYSARRYGIIIDKWFENENGEKVTHNTEQFQELGSYHDGVWYTEGFRFTGFKNINDIKAFNPQTGKRNKASFEKVVEKSVSELQVAAYESGESIEDYYKSIDVDSYRDWYDGRIRFFQRKFGHKSVLHQKFLFKVMGIRHAIRNNGIWGVVSNFLTGAIIGYIGYLSIIYISKLFD